MVPQESDLDSRWEVPQACEQTTAAAAAPPPHRPAGKAVRALIVTENHIKREGLRGLLAGSFVEIAGSAETGAEARGLAGALQVDLIFCGATLLLTEGLDLLTSLRIAFPGSAVIVLSRGDDVGLMSECLRRGVACYLTRHFSRHCLLLAADAALRGYVLVDRGVLKSAFESVAPLRQLAAGGEGAQLTAREREVLALVGQGLGNREIAQRLTVSLGTVRTHLSNIFGKLGVADRVRAALWAAEHGRGPAGVVG